MKRIPLRKDIVSGQRFPKNELVRIVKTIHGIQIQTDKYLLGRGAYLHRATWDLKKLQKNHLLERALKSPIPEIIYQELAELLNG